ncbi:MAG: tetratricopeptide repeat protein [Candidatus Thorarchaeota archaeon]
MVYSNNKEFYNIELLKDICSYKEALEELAKLEENEDLSLKQKIHCWVLKCSILFESGDYRKALNLIEQVCQEYQKLKPNLQLINAYIIKSQILWRQGNPEEALDLIANSKDILKTISQEKSLELKKREAQIAEIKGWIMIFEGDINKAIENMEYSFKLREEVGDEHELALSFHLKGNIYFYFRQDWDTSQKCIEKAYELAKKSDFKSLMSLCLVRFGDFYLLKANIKASFDYYHKALELAKEINYKKGIAFALGGLGLVYDLQGNLDQALKHSDAGVDIYEEMGDISGMIANLDSSFWSALNYNDLEKAEYYFERMEPLVNQVNIKETKIFFQMNKALLLKSSPLISKQMKAKEILSELVKNTNLYKSSLFFEVSYRALLNLCDLLLNELRNTHNLGLLNEIQSCINQIMIISQSTNSYWWLSETYLLQAKLELLTLDLKKAEGSLIQAQKIAEEYDLKQLIDRILVEQDKLRNQIDKWKALKKSKAAITELIDLAQIDEQLIRMLRRRYYSKQN